MEDNEKQGKVKTYRPRAVLLIVLTVLFLVGALLVFFYRDELASRFAAGNRQGYGTEGTFSFASGSDQVCDSFGNGLIVASNNGFHVMNAGGGTIAEESCSMKTPAIACSDSNAAVFDVGGTGLMWIDSKGNVSDLTQNEGEDIISVTMNEDGWMCVNTDATGYRGKVTVYNEKMTPVYEWKSGEGYLISASVSPDDKYLATLTVESVGGVVHLMKLDSEKEIAEFTEEDALITDLHWLSNDRIFLMETACCTVIGKDGKAVGTVTFEDQAVTDFSYGDGFAAIMLSDYYSGTNGVMMTVGADATILGQAGIETDLKAMDANGDYIAALCGDGIYMYTMGMQQAGTIESTTGVQDVVIRKNTDIFLISHNSAQVLSF